MKLSKYSDEQSLAGDPALKAAVGVRCARAFCVGRLGVRANRSRLRAVGAARSARLFFGLN